MGGGGGGGGTNPGGGGGGGVDKPGAVRGVVDESPRNKRKDA